MNKLRVLLVAPTYKPTISGNTTTVERLTVHLQKMNVSVSVLEAGKRVPDRIRRKKFDLVHIFHAYKSRIGLSLAKRFRAPLVTTITGTDVNIDLSKKSRRKSVVRVLQSSSAIITFTRGMSETLAKRLPSISRKTVVIPQSVWLNKSKYDLRGRLNIARNDLVFFLPGGLRPVKDNLFPVKPLRILRRKNTGIQLVLAGPVLDEDYGRRVLNVIRKYDWCHHTIIPHRLMYGAYRETDVVLNASFHEGGMPNSLLEAMRVGRPILASDIPGNSSFIRSGVNGILFRKNQQAFIRKAEMLASSSELRKRLGKNAKAKAMSFSPRAEASKYLAVYSRMLRQ